jgi:hypothetical protein
MQSAWSLPEARITGGKEEEVDSRQFKVERKSLRRSAQGTA